MSSRAVAAGCVVSVLAILCHEDARAGTPLDDLHALLAPMRAQPSGMSGKMRGASEQFSMMKDQLRNWIESRLAGLGADGDEAVLALRLNDELRQADLSCRKPPDRDGISDAPACVGGTSEDSELGFLNDITIQRQSYGYGDEFLIVQTGLGIVCGFDESAYVYQWKDRHWQLTLTSEQDVYTEVSYKPQKIYSVLVSTSAGEKDHRHLVLTLGMLPWCSSNWQAIYYRLWRTSEGQTDPKPLLDRQEYNYRGREPPIEGSVGPNDALIEFQGGSIDFDDVFERPVVRHFQIDGDDVKQIAPIALGPRGFTEEWLTHDWRDSGAWTEASARDALRKWHQKLHADHLTGHFDPVALRCARNADLWQIGFGIGQSDTEQRPVYFTVRWTPPYRFEMAAVAAKPRPDCATADPDAEATKTLFPVQAWR
jgi:hypothetical protein